MLMKFNCMFLMKKQANIDVFPCVTKYTVTSQVGYYLLIIGPEPKANRQIAA